MPASQLFAGGLDTNATKALVSGNTAFASDLFLRLRTNQGNVFFSPYSISTCLAMTATGARGETAQQMSKVLHLGTNQAQMTALFGALQSRLNEAQEKKQIELNIANSLWAQKGKDFLPTFLDPATKDFGATLKQVDYRTAAESARKDINSWVSDSTKGKITDLLAPGVLTADTRLVLVNAIYFKGLWARPFPKSSTTNAPFSITAEQKTQAPLMHVTASFKYAEVRSLQILELPYVGGDISMVILLPSTPYALKILEPFINEQSFNTWLGATREQKVEVYLPRFKMTSSFDLKATLADLGMTSAFSSMVADFSGMDDARDLFLSDVVHKAFVDVNEEGTEAAAATGAVMSLTSAMPAQPPVFRADHPFLFLLRDNKTGSILFMGRVIDPGK
jgi:serpin B